MPERTFDLKDQRLAVSRNLGNDFVTLLESDEEAGEMSGIIIKTREALKDNPNLKILGYKLKENEGLTEIERSLERQVGLPEGFGLIGVSERLAGNEEDFLLIIGGLGRLHEQVKTRIIKKLSSHLRVKSLFD